MYNLYIVRIILQVTCVSRYLLFSLLSIRTPSSLFHCQATVAANNCIHVTTVPGATMVKTAFTSTCPAVLQCVPLPPSTLCLITLASSRHGCHLTPSLPAKPCNTQISALHLHPTIPSKLESRFAQPYTTLFALVCRRELCWSVCPHACPSHCCWQC